MVYKEGCDGIVGSDPVPAWLRRECVHKDFCQCNLVGPRHPNRHYPGSLYSNVISRRHQLFENRCGCSHTQWPFPFGCNRNTKNVEIATKLARIMMHVLTVIPHSVPQRGVPLVSIFRSRELKPKWECERLNRLSMRRAARVRSDDGSGEDVEGDEEEFSEEESVASRSS